MEDIPSFKFYHQMLLSNLGLSGLILNCQVIIILISMGVFFIYREIKYFLKMHRIIFIYIPQLLPALKKCK